MGVETGDSWRGKASLSHTCVANAQLQASTRLPCLVAAALAPYDTGISLLAEAVGEAGVAVAAAHAVWPDGVAGLVEAGARGDVRGADIAVGAVGVEAACVCRRC